MTIDWEIPLVWLNRLEKRFGRLNGLKTYRNSKGRENGRGRHVTKKDIIADDVFGLTGEVAVAKELDIYYEFALNRFSCPDVGQIQVKTSWTHDGGILIPAWKRNEYALDHPYLLVVRTLEPDSFRLAGWIMRDVARTNYKHSARTYNNVVHYKIPQVDLSAIADIPPEYLLQNDGAYARYQPPYVANGRVIYPGSRTGASR